jgi:hypothetical protein
MRAPVLGMRWTSFKSAEFGCDHPFVAGASGDGTFLPNGSTLSTSETKLRTFLDAMHEARRQAQGKRPTRTAERKIVMTAKQTELALSLRPACRTTVIVNAASHTKEVEDCKENVASPPVEQRRRELNPKTTKPPAKKWRLASVQDKVARTAKARPCVKPIVIRQAAVSGMTAKGQAKQRCRKTVTSLSQ